MNILDFFTRFIFIPGIFLFAFNLIPELKEDIKEWAQLFQPVGKPDRKEKAAEAMAVAPDQCSDSFPFSQCPNVCDSTILSHK